MNCVSDGSRVHVATSDSCNVLEAIWGVES